MTSFDRFTTYKSGVSYKETSPDRVQKGESCCHKIEIGEENLKTGHDRKLKIAVAGGGTGGHVFPGIAIAKAAASMGNTALLWIGTGRPIEKKALSCHPWEYLILTVKPLKGVSGIKALASLLHLPIPIIKSLRWLKTFRPDVVLGLGGYVSGPVLLAARLLSIPTLLHEQNLIPGLSNRLASRFADTVCVSFPDTAKWFPKNRCLVTGNPVREEILNSQDVDESSGRKVRILVLGGSQGARGINRLVCSALELLTQSGMDLEVMHQTGPSDENSVKDRYEKANVTSVVLPFIFDMAKAYRWADLVIARAGAGTISELTALGKPSILIPFPAAAGNHQEANAMMMAETGAALCFSEEEIGSVKLASEIQNLIDNRKKLETMGQRAKRLGKPDAAREIASLLWKFARNDCHR